MFLAPVDAMLCIYMLKASDLSGIGIKDEDIFQAKVLGQLVACRFINWVILSLYFKTQKFFNPGEEILGKEANSVVFVTQVVYS